MKVIHVKGVVQETSDAVSTSVDIHHLQCKTALPVLCTAACLSSMECYIVD